ncbi:MAG: hypothetical protein R3214_00840 [Christiangramia sp.]|nr:hypothetical protein [Christiangramia sp.]
MRNKILMYLFIFSVLFTIFIYVNDKRILDSKQGEIDRLQTRLTETESELENYSGNSANEEYFSLENNDDAITYFDNRGIDTEELIPRIEDAIISKNEAGKDNPLVPHAGMEGNMNINRIKVLNHKWIIADFTDGTYWGEVFLSYNIGEDGEIEFIPEKSFLYPGY